MQSFVNESAASWCFFELEKNQYGVLLRSPPSVFSTLYQWKGIFVAIEVNACLQTPPLTMLLNKTLTFQFCIFVPLSEFQYVES